MAAEVPSDGPPVAQELSIHAMLKVLFDERGKSQPQAGQGPTGAVSNLPCFIPHPSIPPSASTPYRLPFQDSKWTVALRASLGNPRARFRSVKMLELLTALYDGKMDTVSVFPTGSGKSMMMLLPVLFEPGMTTIVFSCFKVLSETFADMCGKRRVKAMRYHDELHHQMSGVSGIVVVPIEKVVTPNFLLFVQNLKARKTLARYFIDEAHTVLTQGHFREDVTPIKNLRTLTRTCDVRMHLLTATLPPGWECQLMQACGLRMDATLQFRENCDRSNLGYHLADLSKMDSPDGSYEDKVAEFVGRTLQDGFRNDPSKRNRALVFFPTKAALKSCLRSVELVYGLKMEGYFNEGTNIQTQEENSARLTEVANRWVQGDVTTLCCTSAFGQGVDWPEVRTVIIVGQPFNLLDLAQQCGRAGRDGKPANVHLIPLERPRGPSDRNNLQENLVLENNLFEQIDKIFDCSDDTCLRTRLSMRLDKDWEQVNCLINPATDTVMCSKCDHELVKSAAFWESDLESNLQSECNVPLSVVSSR